MLPLVWRQTGFRSDLANGPAIFQGYFRGFPVTLQPTSCGNHLAKRFRPFLCGMVVSGCFDILHTPAFLADARQPPFAQIFGKNVWTLVAVPVDKTE